MNQIQKLFDYWRLGLTTASLSLMVLSIAQCKDTVEEKCQIACQFAIECTEYVQKRKLDDQEKNSGRIFCIQGCAMLQRDILQCFDETYPSCEGFQRCVIQSGTLE